MALGPTPTNCPTKQKTRKRKQRKKPVAESDNAIVNIWIDRSKKNKKNHNLHNKGEIYGSPPNS